MRDALEASPAVTEASASFDQRAACSTAYRPPRHGKRLYTLTWLRETAQRETDPDKLAAIERATETLETELFG